MNFIHIGAGAGDKDPSSGFRDGFSEYVKKHKSKNKKIIVVEANQKNIKKLRETWKDYKNTKILNYAITPNNSKKKKIKLFYSVDDAPHYQVCSMDINHVQKHYPNSIIDSFKVKALNVNEFINSYIGNQIDYLSIDLEGIDYSILMKIDLSKVTIKNISIEHLHLSKNEKKTMVKHLNNYGYSYCGNGYDHNNFDYLFKKKKISWNRFVSNFLWLFGHKKIKHINKLILKDNDKKKGG